MTIVVQQTVTNHYHLITHICLMAGGLAEEVDEKVLNAAFIPFGDILDIQLPLDFATRTSTEIDHVTPTRDRQTGRQTDGRTDGQTDGRTDR